MLLANSEIIRGSKALRLVRFAKLLKVIKVSKFNVNFVKNNEFTKAI